MRLQLLGLPSSIVVLLANCAVAEQTQAPARWPLNLLPYARFWPGGNVLAERRNLEQRATREKTPVMVKKMGEDERQKFFMEYWGYGEDPFAGTGVGMRERDLNDEDRLLANASAAIGFTTPLAMHKMDGEHQGLRRGERQAAASLQNRDFWCPTGTDSCSAIGYPNSCCADSDTCFAIQDTGLGPVGCCPNGDVCGGTISSCPSGALACADELGGGCCLPGFVCVGVGCESIVYDPRIFANCGRYVQCDCGGNNHGDYND